MVDEAKEIGTHLHHEKPKPFFVEKGERYFATEEERSELIGGISRKEERDKAQELVDRFYTAKDVEEQRKALGDLRKLGERFGRGTKSRKNIENLSRALRAELSGEVPPGRSYLEAKEVERGKPSIEIERPGKKKRLSDEISQERDEEGILKDARPEWLKAMEERYILTVDKPRDLKVVKDQYLRFLAGIGARQPVPGEGIISREWEEIVRYNAEVDAIIRTAKDDKTKEKAQWLKRFASAYVHELEYYHRFWYGEEAGIGKEVNRPKEGSRLLLIDQWAPLFTHPEFGPKVEEAFKKEKGFKSDAELIDEVGDRYGLRRLGHHLRRYSLAPMFRDAYEEGVRIDKAAERIPYKENGEEKEFIIRDPGFGKSFEYSLYSIYYGTSWAKETNPNWKLLIERDADGRPIRDHGELGATYDMWTTPARLKLYLLNWEHIGKRNQIRLTAGRDWLMAHPEAFLPKEESEELRDILWKYQDRENILSEKEKLDQLSDEERKELQKLRETQERLVLFSDEEIRALQEILQKQIRGEGLTPEEDRKMKEFMSVALRNLLNRDLGVDPDELKHGEIWKNPLSRHERITPNDILTNILVDVRRMEQTIDDLVAGSESFLTKLSFEKINAIKTERYAHLPGEELAWLREREINYLREIVTEITLIGIMRDIRYSGSALFEEKRKQIYDFLKGQASIGLHAATLKETYGIDFTESELHERGAPLKTVIEMLYRVHGERKIRTTYKDVDWVIDVLDNKENASRVSKERFLIRFGFNNYTSFEVGIIEEPVLNAIGVTRESLGDMTDRERTRILWLAKKGLLPGNKGIFMKSRDQKLREGWERIPEEEEDRTREEGGIWIEGWVRNSPKPEKWEKVGYMIREKGKIVFYRTIAWEDPVQYDLFDVEQMIYSRNAELISAHLANQSARIKENPNEWLTPPERRNLIDKHRGEIDIDDDRAIELMKIHGCRDADLLLWTAKSWALTYAFEPIARMFPGIRQLQIGRRIPANLSGAGVSAAVGLWTFAQWAAAGPLAAGPLSMVVSAASLIPVSWALRRLARVREIPIFHWTGIGPDFIIGPFRIGRLRVGSRRINFQLRLPFFWLREGKEPPPLE